MPSNPSPPDNGMLVNGGSPCPECQNLRRRVQQLEIELSEAAKTIQEVTDDRDEYRNAVLAAIRKNCSPADWDDFDPKDYTDSFEDVLAEVKKTYGL